jgi:DNA polymerase-3 subunit epsilon
MRLLDSSLGKLTDYCSVLNSLALAKSKHPGQKNNLNALCKRYSVDNSQRQLHGALLDAEILADVYLLLTGGQATLGLGEELDDRKELRATIQLDKSRLPLKVMKANFEELRAHERKLDDLDQISPEGAVWRSRS